MPGERPESKVIRKNCSTIADEITAQGLAQWFATRLSEKEFIASPSAFSALGIPDLNRVTQMLGAVQSRLKTTGTPKEKLEEFITILEDSPALEHLAKEITSKYGRCILQSRNTSMARNRKVKAVNSNCIQTAVFAYQFS